MMADAPCVGRVRAQGAAACLLMVTRWAGGVGAFGVRGSVACRRLTRLASNAFG